MVLDQRWGDARLPIGWDSGVGTPREEERSRIVDVKRHIVGTAWRSLTFVRVLIDEGFEGVGEVRIINHTDALAGYLAEAVPNHVSAQAHLLRALRRELAPPSGHGGGVSRSDHASMPGSSPRFW